jgi:hypothetical protein
MADGTGLGEPELANLSRLLDRAARDPTLLLARACVGDAQQFIARGETTAAQRSIQAAQLAIRLSGQASALGLGPELLPPGAALPPAASDPPRPPARPTLE